MMQCYTELRSLLQNNALQLNHYLFKITRQKSNNNNMTTSIKVTTHGCFTEPIQSMVQQVYRCSRMVRSENRQSNYCNSVIGPLSKDPIQLFAYPHQKTEQDDTSRVFSRYIFRHFVICHNIYIYGLFLRQNEPCKAYFIVKTKLRLENRVEIENHLIKLKFTSENHKMKLIVL